MSLLNRLESTREQVEAVAIYESYCRAIRDATIDHDAKTAPEWKWKLWFEAAEKVREVGLDPLHYSNARRG